MDKASDQSGLITIDLIVTIIFVILKLTDNIDWPWVWVLSPLWITFALVFILSIIFVWVFGSRNKLWGRDYGGSFLG